MNVYDFDGTIFVPDSSYCFVLYCMRHYPRAVFKVLPGTLWQFILYLRAGKKDAGKLKESLFSFLNRVDNIDRIVQEFWTENFERMEAWYLEQKRSDDFRLAGFSAETGCGTPRRVIDCDPDESIYRYDSRKKLP